ncbi:EcsC family protein [Vallitalea okinawensis]|uniref:EcsC family protein n=1 Tax=Vallitalea okinawensis TaxID=2078660 RepID=UPI000CFAF3EC|nr:EcsC family protein [Vallitalea okinawensis]
MDNYNDIALKELNRWKKKMKKKPSIASKASKGVQNKLNGILPEKYHEIVTSAIKNMIKAVLLGSKYVTKEPIIDLSLKEREVLVAEKTKVYKTTAMIEGAGTGAGGIMLGLADLPLLLSIKIKFLYDIASIYGIDVNDYKERIYILYIFQLAFSSKSNVNKVFNQIEDFNLFYNTLPNDINSFDWRTFQQEYRDYIDLAKLLQMIPGIGAVVGAYVNAKLIEKLSKTAIQAYRMRLLQ